jgi:hypothetical protein
MTTQSRPTVTRLPLVLSVGAARERLLAANSALALVTDRDRPIGVVSLDQIDAAVDEADPLASVIDTEVVTIDPESTDLATLGIYRDAAWQSLRRRAPGRSSSPVHRHGRAAKPDARRAIIPS